eukprot:scaffold57391_cov19-Tisochrysis_lutea.AAC.1
MAHTLRLLSLQGLTMHGSLYVLLPGGISQKVCLQAGAGTHAPITAVHEIVRVSVRARVYVVCA